MEHIGIILDWLGADDLSVSTMDEWKKCAREHGRGNQDHGKGHQYASNDLGDVAVGN